MFGSRKRRRLPFELPLSLPERDRSDAHGMAAGRLERAYTSVATRVNRYRKRGDRDAVLGRGALADAGTLWQAGMSDSGTSVRVLYALACLHWCRHQAADDDLLNDFQAALLLFARVGQREPDLVPRELRSSLGRGVTVDHRFIGPEHWGRVGILLLRRAEAAPDIRLLGDIVEIFEGTTAAYPPDHAFWPGDMKNLRYALRLRYGAGRDPADRRRSIEVNRALRRGRSPHEPLGADAPPVPPLPDLGRPFRQEDLERRLARVSGLHARGQHEVAEDEARDLLLLVGQDNAAHDRLRGLLASILDALGEADEARRARPAAPGRAQRPAARARQQRRQPKRTTRRERKD
ncbi:hypothetical protein [Streptomyces marincola]|nr:hypothetical protein [Streptomyces marincola]